MELERWLLPNVGVVRLCFRRHRLHPHKLLLRIGHDPIVASPCQQRTTGAAETSYIGGGNASFASRGRIFDLRTYWRSSSSLKARRPSEPMTTSFKYSVKICSSSRSRVPATATLFSSLLARTVAKDA